MKQTFAVIAVVLTSAVAHAGGAGGGPDTLWEEIKSDHLHFYSGVSLLELGGGLAVAGALANSSVDQEIRDWYQEDIRSSGTDDFAEVAKPFGDGFITVPILLGASVLDVWRKDSRVCGAIGEWGQRSLRGMLVGVPPLLVIQQATGGGRPSDGQESDWKPFEEGHGASGHAFMGAVPFLTASRMVDNVALKSVCYLASTLAGVSRINDDDHYASQVVLGWWLAWLAVDAVDGTETPDKRFRVTAIAKPDWSGIGVQMAF